MNRSHCYLILINRSTSGNSSGLSCLEVYKTDTFWSAGAICEDLGLGATWGHNGEPTSNQQPKQLTLPSPQGEVFCRRNSQRILRSEIKVRQKVMVFHNTGTFFPGVHTEQARFTWLNFIISLRFIDHSKHPKQSSIRIISLFLSVSLFSENSSTCSIGLKLGYTAISNVKTSKAREACDKLAWYAQRVFCTVPFQ